MGYFMSGECPGNAFAVGSIVVLAKFAAVAASATPVTMSFSDVFGLSAHKRPVNASHTLVTGVSFPA